MIFLPQDAKFCARNINYRAVIVSTLYHFSVQIAKVSTRKIFKVAP